MNTQVAILVQTMNRADFVIRTLEYYAGLNSPHPVYVSDSSNPDHAKRIKAAIERLGNRLKVHYNWFPPGFETTNGTLELVKEKYAVVNGDDDYSIPATLTKCAEFLENNPDYMAAGGHGVSFRLKSSGPHGEIKRLADYPNHAIESETSSQRLVEFLRKCFVVTFSVCRVEQMRKIYVVPLPIITTWSELYQNCNCAVFGKVKVLDCLGVVRQIHDRQYHSTSMVDWITEKGFHDYYTIFRDHLARNIIGIDNVSLEQAERTVKDAFWEYLQVYMANEQKVLGVVKICTKNQTVLGSTKNKLSRSFPVLKILYRKYLRSAQSSRPQMHYEVLQPSSKYYKDFKPVMDSFSDKLN